MSPCVSCLHDKRLELLPHRNDELGEVVCFVQVLQHLIQTVDWRVAVNHCKGKAAIGIDRSGGFDSVEHWVVI